MHRTLSISSACTVALLVLASGCSQGSSPKPNTTAPGTLLQDPTSSDGFTYFLADSNFNGDASVLYIQKVVWGRLVDLYAEDSGTGLRTKVMRDLLVDPTIQSDGVDYLLEQNPVTLREQLVILHAFGSTDFDLAFQPLRDDVGLGAFINKGVSANELPPFTAVPCNATIVVQFNDLLDPATVSGANVESFVGYPPTAPFEARVVPDRSHGGLVDGVMRSSRVIIDPTIGQDEAQSLGLKVNARGLPAAANTLQVNVALRIPTVVNPTAAQFNLLRNLSGHALAFSGNGPADAGSPTLDVVRGFRSGGPNLVTGDLYNGYLLDNDAPDIVGAQQVLISAASAPLAPGQFQVSMDFVSTTCAIQPRAGDLIVVQNGVLEVLSPGDPLAGGTVTDMLVLRVDESVDLDTVPALGPAEFRTPWTAGLGFLPGCFVNFNPGAGTAPADDVPTTSTVRLNFSEPMDSVRTNGFDGIQIVDPTVPVNKPLSRTVVARMAPSANLTSYVLEPAMPFKHTSGSSETFNIDVISEADLLSGLTFGVTDLAGNVLAENLPQVTFTLASAAPTLSTGSFSLRFNDLDEDNNNFPEVRGQIVPDLSRGVMQSRAVVRFSTFVDPTPLSTVPVQNMTPLGGVVEPLSIYGSRTMALWRYSDLGIPLLEENSLNLDVEGLAWMIFGSGVSLDNFPEFELNLAHSKFVPDEVSNDGLVPPSLLWPASGLGATFEANAADALVTVSPQSNGYLIQSLDSFKTPSDSLMAPYPLNRNMPVSQYTYWTWRDTSNLALGGPFSGGVAPYAANLVPTLGLPLLMDFKTYPAPTQAQGFNRLFLGGANTATFLNFNLPFFRAHSTGGIKADLAQQLIDPDTQVTAVGGLDLAGAPTAGVDNGFYYGNADFVTRVSQMHTIWFDTGNTSQFNNIVTIPAPEDVPAGLSLIFAFRGATIISAAVQSANANNLDPYGDAQIPTPPFSVTFLNGDKTWKSSLTELNGARFIQVRVTMIANAETSAVSEIDAMGFSYSQ